MRLRDDTASTLINPERRMHFTALAEACVAPALDDAAFARAIREHGRVLLPHASLLAAIGRLSFDHVVIEYLNGVDYHPAHLAQIPRQLHVRERPILSRWLRERDALVVDPKSDRDQFSAFELREVFSHGLGRLAIHGVADPSGKYASYFSFSGVQGEADELKQTLRLMTPLLHQAVMSLRNGAARVADASALSSEDFALLELLACGRSNAEIGKVTGKSEKTIRNRMTRIYADLGVASRTEAVSVYLQLPRGRP
jgi:DNA-binding CsgD family transcriptional regulator